MKVFDGISPNAGDESIKQGFKAIARQARRMINGRPEWALFEARLDAEDKQWLFDWARNLQPEIVRYWLDDGKSADYAIAFGILLTLLAVENARAGLPQAKDWPLPIDLTFNAGARAALFNGDDPKRKQAKAIRLAVKKFRLKRGISFDPKQWLRETIALQINPADEPAEDLPRWIPETIAFVDERRRTQSPAPEERRRTQSPAPEERRRTQSPAPVVHGSLAPTVVYGQSLQSASPYDHSSPDDIFGRIEVRVGVTTIEEAARAMLDRAREKGLMTGAWSLAELEPTDYDYSWLRVWVKNLDENTVKYFNSPFRRFKWTGSEYPLQAAFGLLLMMWISESARREAEEGWLWRWIPRADINDKAARRLLFTQDQPSSFLKELLEVSARRFNLRHVFGRVGAQQWIDTIFLQFGFTRRGFERRLPEWLARQAPTQAVRSLLDPGTGSASFQELWEALRNYSQKNITRAQALSKLQNGGWLLPEWIEQTLELAKAPIVGAMDAAASNAEPEAGDSFLTEPLLRWDPPAAPYFACQLVYLDALGLTEDVYDLAVNGRVHTQLLGRADGGYTSADGEEIRMPFEEPRATVQVIDNEGRVVADEDTELWPPSEDVVIFLLNTGRKLSDAYRQSMSANAPYAVLTAPDLRMEPQPAYSHSGPKAKLFYLSRNWSRETRLLLDDDVLWEPFFQQRPAAGAAPWMAQVQLYVDPPARLLRWGDKIHLKVKHPDDVTISFARYSGNPVEFAPLNGQCTRVGPLRLAPESSGGALRLQLGIKRQNQLHRATLEISANIIGVAKRKNGSWNPLAERFVLQAETARSAQFKIAPPRRWDDREPAIGEWALMEGDLWLKNLSRNHSPIGDVAGLGAPMTLRLGPYNADRDAMTVAQSVIDCGVIEEFREVRGELSLRLSRHIEPGDQHRIVYWDLNGQIHELQALAQEDMSSDHWRCASPDGAPGCLAVALMYEGCRLGAQWLPDWHVRIKKQAEADPRRVATMLRWFRLPMLAENALNNIRAIAERHAAEFLPAWLQEGAHPSFILPDVTEGWLAAVRTVYRNWTPCQEDANRLINSLCEQDSFRRAAWRLLKVDPRLLYKTMRGWLATQPNQQVARNSISELRLQIAEAEDDGQFEVQRRHLLEEGAREWRVDTKYIYIGIINRAVASANGGTLLPRDEMNIALPISSESLRRLLAISLLKFIA